MKFIRVLSYYDSPDVTVTVIVTGEYFPLQVNSHSCVILIVNSIIPKILSLSSLGTMYNGMLVLVTSTKADCVKDTYLYELVK